MDKSGSCLGDQRAEAPLQAYRDVAFTVARFARGFLGFETSQGTGDEELRCWTICQKISMGCVRNRVGVWPGGAGFFGI